jgi:hypothetical protein
MLAFANSPICEIVMFEASSNNTFSAIWPLSCSNAKVCLHRQDLCDSIMEKSVRCRHAVNVDKSRHVLSLSGIFFLPVKAL